MIRYVFMAIIISLVSIIPGTGQVSSIVGFVKTPAEKIRKKK